MIKMELQLFGGRGGRSNMSSSTSGDSGFMSDRQNMEDYAIATGALDMGSEEETRAFMKTPEGRAALQEFMDGEREAGLTESDMREAIINTGSASNQSGTVKWAARNGAENNSQYRLDYTETVSGNTWKLDGQPKGRRSERGNARAEITPNTDGGFTVRRWGKDGSQLERQTFNNIGPALQTTKTYLRSGYKRT